jgi:hypothetical protein
VGGVGGGNKSKRNKIFTDKTHRIDIDIFAPLDKSDENYFVFMLAFAEQGERFLPSPVGAKELWRAVVLVPRVPHTAMRMSSEGFSFSPPARFP